MIEKEVVHIGEWCLFSIDEQWLLGVILSFSYLNQKTYRAQEYSYSSVEIEAIRQKPVGALCTLYEWSQNRKLKYTTGAFKNTFIPIECYKGTIASPSFVKGELLLHELVFTKIEQIKSMLDVKCSLK